MKMFSSLLHKNALKLTVKIVSNSIYLHVSKPLLLTLHAEMLYWMQCYEQLYVFSLQLILDGSECPLNVILFFSAALKPQLQRIGHR